MKRKFLLLILLISALRFVQAQTVVDVIVNSPVHNTLEAAVGAAGLVNTLNGAGPFTVFAPTDAAFAALPTGTVETLLQDPQGLLTNILLNHVSGANVLSSGLTNNQSIVTLNNGKTVKVTINNEGVFIDEAQVTVADIETDNGIVHVIDAVLPPPNTVVDVITGSANTLLQTFTMTPGLNMTVSGPSAICEGDSAVLTASGASNYSWSASPAYVFTDSTSATQTFFPVVTTVLTITGTAAGCSQAITYTLTLNAKPDAIASPAAIEKVSYLLSDRNTSLSA